MTPSALAVTAGLALAMSAALTPPFRRLALATGLLDRSSERSSHEGVVARGGGVVVLVAVLLAVAAGLGADRLAERLAFVGGLVMVGGLGLCDDRWTITPGTRLFFQALAAALVVAVSGGLHSLPLPPPLDVEFPLPRTAAVLWIVAVLNFYNFLDGIDGLAASQAVVTGTGLALAGWDPFAAAAGAAVAGACAGFLFYNWSPARIFMGDVGSGALGFLFAAAPLLAPPAERPRAVLFVATSLFLFLADATWTLLKRIARGARWYEAHREHAYQRLVIGGWTHAQATLLVAASATLLTAAALAAWRTGKSGWSWLSLALAGGCFVLELALARRAEAVRQGDRG
jgi:UDP-N-acetylmuramyl pentapeptide phosphotransferase/UDP-N-acetylglucosamine-1-phosphate transferase